MNREILFKGKRLGNGQWVEGNYGFFKSVNGNEKMHHITIEDGKAIRIDFSTLCQFTGMTDKNGNKVWEHDIIALNEDVKKIFNVDDGEIRYGWGGFYIKKFSELNSLNTLASYNCILRGEVIGNVFDNPELLNKEV